MKKILFLSLFLMICAVLSAQKRIKVACVGNSITYGYTLPNPATDSYPSQLQQLLGDTYEVGNFGKSGATLLNKGHRPYMQQEELLLEMCSCYGVTEDDILLLLDYGYSADEIEEMLCDSNLLLETLCAVRCEEEFCCE